MICEVHGCDVRAWALFGLVALLCVSVLAVECNPGGLARHLAPKYHAFFMVLPPSGRWLWRATVFSCVAILVLFGFAISFFPDLWVPAVWLSDLMSPWMLIAATVSILWAAFRSASTRE
jgi:hypothetical protein